jgi:hypothetical protein
MMVVRKRKPRCRFLPVLPSCPIRTTIIKELMDFKNQKNFMTFMNFISKTRKKDISDDEVDINFDVSQIH